MRILKSIQLLALVLLIIGCAKEDNQVYVEPVEELSSTKASACRSSLIFNTTPVTRSLSFAPFNNGHMNAFAFDGHMYTTESISRERLDGSVYAYWHWWRSGDGVRWNKVELPKSLTPKNAQLITFNNQLWCFEESGSSRVWKLVGGSLWIKPTNWQSISNDLNIQNFDDHLRSGYIAMRDKILFVFQNSKGDILVRYSSDMVNWTTKAINSRTNVLRANATYTVFNGKIWIIGGSLRPGDQGYSWYSSDGVNWSEATTSKRWNLRSHATVVYDNKLWVIGGVEDGTNFKREVWVSKDGLSWSEVTRYNTAPFSPRANHSAIAFKDRLWVIGGLAQTGGIGSRTGEVWNMRKCSTPSTFSPKKGG